MWGVQRGAAPWLWVSNRGEKHPCWHTILLAKSSVLYLLRRGMSASETGRDHIPPRVFKQMTRLTKQMQKLDAMLSDVKLTNYKVRATQIADLLANLIEKYAAVLDIDNLPEPPNSDSTENGNVNDYDKNFTDSCIDSEKTA